MDIIRLLVVLSPPLIVYATAKQSASGCMVPVTDVSSVFSQSDVTTPPLSGFTVSDYAECNEKCCQQENCNVVTFNESSPAGENNCLLYACHPTNTCNFVEQDGVLIFVDTATAAFSTPNSTTASTTSATTAAENATTEYLTTSTTLTTTDLSSSNKTPALSSTTFATISSLSTLNASSEAPTTTPPTTAALDNNNSTEKVGITATPTLSSVTTIENSTAQNNNISTIEPFQQNGTDSFPATQSNNVTLAFFNMVTENATNMTVTPSTSQSTGTVTPTVLVTSSLPHLQSSVSTSVGTVSSEATQITQTTAATESFSSTIMIQPTAATTTMATTTDQLTTELTTTDSSQQSASVTQPPDTSTASTIDYFTASTGFNETYNATSFQDAAAGVETAEAMTAILICALTFGCVFLLAVIGVLGKRIYEGYKKRHYSRLDYLINGMYN